VNRILVVEDERDLAVTYDRLLRREGYRVVTAASRVEGLKVIESVPPALVIVDLRLPDGDGLDVIRAARTSTPMIPVIVVTAFASRAARDAAHALGASAFLAKPFVASALLRLVHDEFERTIPEAERRRPPCHPIP
jgi:DNA-binding response OmpR family regulator